MKVLFTSELSLEGFREDFQCCLQLNTETSRYMLAFVLFQGKVFGVKTCVEKKIWVHIEIALEVNIYLWKKTLVQWRLGQFFFPVTQSQTPFLPSIIDLYTIFEIKLYLLKFLQETIKKKFKQQHLHASKQAKHCHWKLSNFKTLILTSTMNYAVNIIWGTL